ncbi:MAG: two-component sensor histidine kinase [Crocinitomix sp.]|jgi:two-component sensor histidine kinase
MKIILFILLFLPVLVNAQTSDEIQVEITLHFKLADQYNDIALYGECIGELDEVINLSNKYKLEKSFIKASIIKAEIFRKTQNFERGIILLESLNVTEEYPLLHVQKLGRLAALYAENGNLDTKTQDDSIKAFINEAIPLAIKFNFKEEEAGLRNELGFRQNRQRIFDAGLNNLLTAAELYEEIGDTINEISVLVNVLDLYVNAGNFDQFDSLYPVLVDRVEETEWYSVRSNLYRIINAPFAAEGDIESASKWSALSNAYTVKRIEKTNSSQMAAFKIIHDTNLYKEDALRKSRDLERQNNNTQKLYFFIITLVLVIIIVIIILIRERKLKKKLNSTVNDLNLLNDKYQMLIVESNHRIKNNLQMIISMLEYTKKKAKNVDPKFVMSISSKIQTISALHKHLYLDVHNGLVELETYFLEVFKHYKAIEISYKINHSICPVKIQGERIVYFGLILNEMLANTLEHGDSRSDQLIIEVKPHENGYYFSYKDDSIHPEKASMGIGTKLIAQLVRRINGTNYKLDSQTGKYEFFFKAN